MNPLRWIYEELGIGVLVASDRDTHLLLLSRFARMMAYGASSVILAIYFTALGHSEAKTGLFMTLTLLGDVVISLGLTLVADRLGRRRMLMLGALMMSFSGVVFGIFSNYWILVAAAIIGVISPSGNEIGPFRAIEESVLAHLSDPDSRSYIFSWALVCGQSAAASGALACGWTVQRLQSAHWGDVKAFRFIFWIYALLGLVKFGLALLLSEACEVGKETKKQDVSERETEEAELEELGAFLEDDEDEDGDEDGHKSKVPEEDRRQKLEERRIELESQKKPKPTGFMAISRESWVVLIKLCLLFAFDSLGSGLVSPSLISFYIDRKFHPRQGIIGSIMSVTWILSALSNLFASSIAKRIGLIKTMVFTHLPSAIFLALIAAPSHLSWALVFMALRFSVSSMDQAPRSAFLSAVVLAEERTAVMGIVNVVKTLSQSAGPSITGLLAKANHFGLAFVLAGGLKATYDLGLLAMFVGKKPEDIAGHRR
ncbi:MAG: hypothetical protein M1819_006193 [Sarea resinae]|nr:MAG: hypothetical protein M1819_006193 [Sarea resinae]